MSRRRKMNAPQQDNATNKNVQQIEILSFYMRCNWERSESLSPVEGVKNNDLMAYQSVVNKIFIIDIGSVKNYQTFA